MMKYFIIKNIEAPLAGDLRAAVCRFLKAAPGEIADILVLRRSLDARKKNRLKYVYHTAVSLKDGRVPQGHEAYAAPEMDFSGGEAALRHRPVIVGAGPAGLFAAHVLAAKGRAPLVLEQGKPVAERVKDVAGLWETGRCDPRSNTLFGEGGAGTFSDGKLTARTRSPESDFFFKALIRFGADPSVAYEAKPHLGTDNLRRIIPAMTADLVKNGAQILTDTRVTALKGGEKGTMRVSAGDREWVSDCVILAAGHSAYPLYSILERAGVSLEKKEFAVGVRVEHPREFIDFAQYGPQNDFSATGHADYHLTAATSDNRGVYSFCVCPGGRIINASSSEEFLSVNGMSLSGRDGPRTNGAVVVSVRKTDLPDHPLAGILFRQAIERACRKEGLLAPVQGLPDFYKGLAGKAYSSTYKPGCYPADINALLPPFVVKGLKEGFAAFERKIRGFIDKGVLVAPETGTSSPVRITRNPATFESVNCPGLFPAGEGSGYAGGIVSSAVDGIRIAMRFRPA